MLQVVEINAIEHLEAIRLRWTSLLYETPGASFFHTLDWLQVYWQQFRERQRLRVLVAHHGGTVFGILPLVQRNEPTAAGQVDVLTYPTIHPSHLCGPLGPNPTATLMASLRHLAGQARDWDLLSLSSMGEHDHGRTATALELAGFSAREDVHATASKVCFGVEHQVVERANDLDRESNIAGDLRFERLRPLGSLYGDDQPLAELVEQCLALRWNSCIASDGSTELLRDLADVASRLGMLDLNLLKLDGRLIAFSLNVQWDGVIQQICVGAAGASCRFDPARLLTLRMLRDSFSRRDRCIYFAESNDGLTKRWAARQLPVIRYQHRAAMPPRTRLARIGRWLASPLTNV